jgi:glucokinase
MKENERDVKPLDARDALIMLLAGDVGGTKTLLGLFDSTPIRPNQIASRSFSTGAYTDLAAMIADFVNDAAVDPLSIESACFGVAGPVLGETARLTNVDWIVDAPAIAGRFGYQRVDLLNDLEAMAYGVTVLHDSEVHWLQKGQPRRAGNLALIAAGTGLGEAMLHAVDGRVVPSASEGGHADFAARNAREIALLESLTARFGRADVEGVLSGPGIVNIHRVTHPEPCLALDDRDAPHAPATITIAALQKRCPGCVEALEMFVEAYGAEAGNLALRTVATGGLFVGGGIAPRILPAMTDGRFLRHFLAKGSFESLLTTVPVAIILNAETGLLGAAVFALQRAEAAKRRS